MLSPPTNNHAERSHKKIRVGLAQITVVISTLALLFFSTVALILSNGDAVVSNSKNEGETQAKLTLLAPQNEHRNSIQESNADKSAEKSSKNSFHFIVSSDCTSYQRWETLTQLHSAQNVRQCGRFTWIVSGCLEDGSEHEGKGKGGANSDILTHSLLLEEVERHFPHFTISNHTVANGTGRTASLARDNGLPLGGFRDDCSVLHPHVHFTPDFSDMRVYGGPYADGSKKRFFMNRQGKIQYGNFGNTYKFNNKPNGLHHWIVDFLEHDNRRDEAVVLVDPDFLFLAQFELPEGSALVAPGKPAAAKYGLGGQFLDFNLTQICHRAPLIDETSSKPKPCPFGSITNAEVNKFYSAGPPYIIHIEDVYALSKRWVELVPPTYDEYPLLYAEMFAYSMATADLNLKHNLIKGLFTGCMVTWPHTHGKDELKALQRSAITYANLIENDPSGQEASGGGASSCFLSPLKPPPFLHYCQRYSFLTPYDAIEATGTAKENTPIYHFFAKRRVDHDILECDHNGTLEPFIETNQKKISRGERDWHVLAVCSVVRAINFAKEKGCKSSDPNQ